MQQEQRRALIGKNLGIRPISHGQIYTYQVAVPKSSTLTIDFEREQLLEASLLEHQSNLVTLIVRRTKAYNDDIDYEVVFGADWLVVAQKLDIEMLWAWVFDMTDEQAALANQQMEQLLGSTTLLTVPDDSASTDSLTDKKLQLIADSLKQTLAASFNRLRDEVSDRLDNSSYKLNDLNSAVLQLSEQVNTLHQKLEQGIKPGRKVVEIDEDEKVNLSTANDKEISSLLARIGVQKKQVDAALAAIQYWKQSDEELSWENLELSAKAKSGSHKIANFAKGTYQKLRAIGEI